MVNAGIPLMMQLGLCRDRATLVDMWQQRVLADVQPHVVDISVTIRDLATAYSRDLAAELAWINVAVGDLSIEFSGKKNTTSDDELPQAVINSGALMNRAYQWSRVNSREMVVSCKKIPNRVFAAICSATPVRSDTPPILFFVDAVNSESWPWLMYAVCCAPSIRTDLTIEDATLTNSALSSVADVVRYNYPHSKSAGLEGSRTATASEFGFVDIVEGTAVWPIDFKNDEAPAFVVPSSQRCRAWFKENGAVEVIVPGVGPCPARIEGGIFEVSRDLEDQNWQASSTLRSLNVPFTSIGSPLWWLTCWG